MKTTLSTRLHAATWIVALILTAVPAIKGLPVEQITGNIIAILFWMAVYYLFFLYLAPAGLQKGRIFQYFGISFLIIAVLPFPGYTLLFLSRALFNGSFADFYNGYSIAMHLSGLKAMALAGVYGSFFRLITDHFGN
jgi:hypothetical protein